jgi:hypothetical protein
MSGLAVSWVAEVLIALGIVALVIYFAIVWHGLP